MPRMSEVVQRMERPRSALSYSYVWAFLLLLQCLTVSQMSNAMKFAVTVSSNESAYTLTTNVIFPERTRAERSLKDSQKKDSNSVWPFQSLAHTCLSDAKYANILLTDHTLTLVPVQSGCLRSLLMLMVWTNMRVAVSSTEIPNICFVNRFITFGMQSFVK